MTVVSEAEKGAVLKRDNPDEYMLLLPPGTEARGECQWRQRRIQGESLFIMPPGDSEIVVRKAGTVVRVFSNKASDLMAAAKNSATYADGAPELTPIMPWPDPVGGFRLRHYDLSKIASPDPSPLKMRLFRSTNLMINIFVPWTKRRDEKSSARIPTRTSSRCHSRLRENLSITCAIPGHRTRRVGATTSMSTMTVPRCSSFRRG